jgi:hypothetical protein
MKDKQVFVYPNGQAEKQKRSLNLGVIIFSPARPKVSQRTR